MLQSQSVSMKGFEHRSNKIQSLNASPFVSSIHEGVGSKRSQGNFPYGRETGAGY